jgi:HK97 family phage major capsid protein/HK97 family phage prohead protease
MTQQLEHLVLETKFHTDDTGAIEGIAWDFSSPDRVGDMIDPAAFAGVVGKTIPALFAHDQSQVVGVFDSITVEADGLHVKGRLLIDTVERAREVRSMIQAKAVRGLSIGFITRKAAPRKGGGRTIQSLELLETSIVAVPAHPNARITSQKELPLTTENTNPDLAAIETKLAAAETKAAAAETKAAEAVAAMKARIDGLETKLNRPAIITDKKERTAEQKAFNSYLRMGAQAPAEELKSLRIADDTSGGYFATTDFQTEIIKNVVLMSPIRQAARVGSTASGSVTLPVRTGTPNTVWVGETETRIGTQSAYGQLEIPIFEQACFVDVSLRLLEDSAINIESEVAFDLGQEFGRSEAAALMGGDGIKKPVGLMNTPAIGYTFSGNASTLGSAPADLLVDTFYTLPAFYRNRGAWAMNGTTLAAVRKLKDGQGGYLWQPSLILGQPETILGRPVVEDPTMANIGAASEPIIFGDFDSAFRIYDRVGLSIFPDPYTMRTSGLMRYHARRRIGAAVVLAEALRKIRCATS